MVGVEDTLKREKRGRLWYGMRKRMIRREGERPVGFGRNIKERRKWELEMKKTKVEEV